MLRIGMDIGSTTLKCIVLNNAEEVLYKKYERHFAKATAKAAEMLSEIANAFPEEKAVSFCISGSAGMGLAETAALPFEQEVYATKRAIEQLLPATDTVIELEIGRASCRERV